MLSSMPEVIDVADVRLATSIADGQRLRVADLARRCGLSAQQIRNYVDQGVLPPAERTASGYRMLTGRHAAALVAARLMAAGHGWNRTRAVLHAVHAGDLETALALIDQGHAELDRERAEIATVLAAFETLVASARPALGAGTQPASTDRAEPRPAAAQRRPARIGEVARAVGVRTSALRLWQERGLLRPTRQPGTGYRLYDETEQLNAHVIALLRRGGYSLAIVDAALALLRTTGNPERVRAALHQREQDLEHRSTQRLRGSAALYGYLTRIGLVPR